MADIYGPAEDFIGQFRRKLLAIKGEEELDKIRALTKWVPQPGRITRSIVNESIDRSLHRMGVSMWIYYNSTGGIITIPIIWMHSNTYPTSDEGKIKHIGLTNFDTERLQIMIDSDLQIVSNQVQYSIIDRRPEVKMIPFCLENNISLLCYGSICGGLMSERYLGRMQPSTAELNTLSLQKYKKMIDAWGGWSLFQELCQH